jgi:hypothetical protein
MTRHNKPSGGMTFKQQEIAISKALIPFKANKTTALSIKEVIKDIDLEALLRHQQGLTVVPPAPEKTLDDEIDAMLSDAEKVALKPEMQPRVKLNKQIFHIINPQGIHCFDEFIRAERAKKIYNTDQGTTFPAGHRGICRHCGQLCEVGDDIVMRQPD